MPSSIRPRELQDQGIWRLYRFRFKAGGVTTGQPLASILGRVGVNLKAAVGAMNALTPPAYRGIKVSILFYLNKKTKDYRVMLGADSVTAVVLKHLKLVNKHLP